MATPTEDYLLGDELMHNHDLADINPDLDERYLRIDQNVEQTVINGLHTFERGLIIKAGEKIYFDG